MHIILRMYVVKILCERLDWKGSAASKCIFSFYYDLNSNGCRSVMLMHRKIFSTMFKKTGWHRNRNKNSSNYLTGY